MGAYDDGYAAGQRGDVGVCLADPAEDDLYQAGYAAGRAAASAAMPSASEAPPPESAEAREAREAAERADEQRREFLNELSHENPQEWPRPPVLD